MTSVLDRSSLQVDRRFLKVQIVYITSFDSTFHEKSQNYCIIDALNRRFFVPQI